MLSDLVDWKYANARMSPRAAEAARKPARKRSVSEWESMARDAARNGFIDAAEAIRRRFKFKWDK